MCTESDDFFFQHTNIIYTGMILYIYIFFFPYKRFDIMLCITGEKNDRKKKKEKKNQHHFPR